MSISKENGIGEVVSKYPETTEVFFRHGMGCLGCAIAHFESIEQGGGGTRDRRRPACARP
jgi:hybrid cluster-associated redox disulfide protein